MDTIRWSHPDGDFTISNSGGRLLIGIEPPDGSWHSIWADWGWEGQELGLRQPLEWDDEHGNRARAAFGLGNVAVRISIRVEGDDGSLDDAPSVLLDREHWIEAVDALLQPTRGEFWAEVAAAQPPAEVDRDEEDPPDARWTGEGGDFVISRAHGWLALEIDGEQSVVWAPECEAAPLLALSESFSWEDEDGAVAEFVKITPRKRLRRGEPRVAIRIWDEDDDADEVTLSLEQWTAVVAVLTEDEW